MKTTLKILLVISIGVLSYLCVMSIVTPIKFDEEREKREKEVISQLIDIRRAQIEFKNQHGRYTASTDTLIEFIKNGKMPQVLKEGALSDDQLKAGLTEKKALAIIKRGNKKEIAENGLENFRRDTSYVSVYESFFKNKYTLNNISSMVIIKHSDNQKFEMETRMYTNQTSGIIIPLFIAKASYQSYLGDLNKQQLINLIDLKSKLNKFAGLSVGSIEEPNNNAGNWE